MALINVYRVTYTYSSNQAKHETFTELVSGAAGSGAVALGATIKAQLPRGTANINVLSVVPVLTNVIS